MEHYNMNNLTSYEDGDTLTEKEKIVKLIRQYLLNVTHINNCVSLVKTIDRVEQEYGEKINKAPTFFGVTKQAITKNIIIDTYKLFDFSLDGDSGIKPNRGTRNIGQFLSMMEMKTKMLSRPLYNGEEIGEESKQLVRLSMEEFYEYTDVLKKVKFQRDKIYAHSDKKYFLYKDQRELGEKNITYQEIDMLMMFSTKVLNNFLHYLNEIPQATLSVNTDDLLNLFVE